jgi:aspartate/methionine/tyrosine aminotransferase
MLHIVPAFSRIGEENAFAVLARATALAAQGRDIVNLGIGQPDFSTPPHIVEAAVKALHDGHHGYTPATGILPLREAVAADLDRRFQAEVSPENVLIVPGGKVTMFMAILMFGEPGRGDPLSGPGFPIYRSMIEFTGATPVPVPIRERERLSRSRRGDALLITPRTRLLIVKLARPTRPGGVRRRAEIERLVAGSRLHPRRGDPLRRDLRHHDYDGEAHVTLLDTRRSATG